MTSDSQQLTQEALDAFWECITRRLPEATTGDLSPLISFHLTQAAESAVKEWVFANVPKRRRRKAAPVTQAESTHTPGPWFVGGIDMDCARFGITSREPTKYIASVGLLDDPILRLRQDLAPNENHPLSGVDPERRNADRQQLIASILARLANGRSSVSDKVDTMSEAD